jgi:hypothetical protein
MAMAHAIDKSTPEATQVVTGRTQWDAAVDIMRLLGAGGPYLLLVGLVIFGFYKFQELSQQREGDLQKGRELATEQYRQQLAAANKALVDTYQAMGNISGVQIKNLSDMLELHAKATTRTQELQQNEEQARIKLEEATRGAEKASNQKIQIELELNKIQDSVSRDKLELDRLEKSISEGKRNLSDSATQVQAIRDKMIELAHAVRNQQNSKAQQLAGTILQENSEPLVARASVPDADALKGLIGLSDADTVATLVNDNNTAFVVRSSMPVGADDHSLLAAQTLSGNLFRNLVLLGSDGNRIVSASLMDSLFGTLTPDEDNWYSQNTELILQSKSSASGRHIGQPNDRVWDIENIGRVLKNYNRKLPYLTLEQLSHEAPDLFDWFKSSPFCALACGMSVRAKDFDADMLFGSAFAGLGVPRDLRESAVRLFNAAVKQQIPVATNLITDPSSSPDLPGQVAAIVLHPDFEFTRYVPVGSSDSTTSANSATLVGHYDYRTHGFRKYGLARERAATFTFSRDGTTWRLEKLTTGAQEPVSAAK